VVKADLIRERTGIERVSLINDLEANAYGVETLGPEACHVLKDREPAPRGNRALVSAGTGLGQAGMVWEAGRYRPFASEGGHADFAPGSDLEIALLQFLWGRFGRHVSWERVLCGPGIVNLFDFLRQHQRWEPPDWLLEEMADSDPAAAVSRAAQQDRCEICVETMKLFVGLYGAQAGNVALGLLATGGVYLGGGIAPKILDFLEGPGFLEAFHAKGRMRPLVESMPVKVILDEGTALLGAARHAVLSIEEG
jgi:glucokinase